MTLDWFQLNIASTCFLTSWLQSEKRQVCMNTNSFLRLIGLRHEVTTNIAYWNLYFKTFQLLYESFRNVLRCGLHNRILYHKGVSLIKQLKIIHKHHRLMVLQKTQALFNQLSNGAVFYFLNITMGICLGWLVIHGRQFVEFLDHVNLRFCESQLCKWETLSRIVKVNETRQVGLLPQSSTQISLSRPRKWILSRTFSE